MKLLFILVLTFIIFVTFALFGFTSCSIPMFYISGGSLISFIFLYVVGVLDYQIGGQYLTLQKRINTLEQENKKLKEVVNSLLKFSYVHLHAPMAWNGIQEPFKILASDYLKPIKELVEPNLEKSVKQEITKMNE